MNIFAWIFAVINSVAPVDGPQWLNDSKETVAEATSRYESIAKDLVDVVFDPNEKPLYDGPNGRVKTAAVILAIDSFESGFRKDVDYGIGSQSRGDHGSSWCLGQINLGDNRFLLKPDGSFEYSSKEGWSGRDLVNDRKKCFRAQLAILRLSYQCPITDDEQKLNLYASGSCYGGVWHSRNRMKRAQRFLDQTTLVDDDILKPKK